MIEIKITQEELEYLIHRVCLDRAPDDEANSVLPKLEQALQIANDDLAAHPERQS